MLSAFSIRDFNILIINILNSLSDHFKICVIPKSSSYASFISSDSIYLVFSVPCHFLFDLFFDIYEHEKVFNDNTLALVIFCRKLDIVY